MGRGDPILGLTRTERCPEGKCRSVAYAYPEAHQDRDRNFWTCVYCNGGLCSACNSCPAPCPSAFCEECDSDDGDDVVPRMEQERPSEVTDTAWAWAEVEGAREARQASGGGGNGWSSRVVG